MFDMRFPAVLDSTIMKEWTRCRYSAMQKYFMGKRPADGNSHDLNVGLAIASGMETTRKLFYMEGMSDFDAIENGILKMIDVYGDDVPESVKSISRCKEIFNLYFKKYPLDNNFGLVPIELGVECKFSFGIGVNNPDTGDEILYSGRFDMIAKEKNPDPFFSMSEEEGTWIVDEKTTKMLFGANWMYDYDLDWQMIGYKWASEKMGHKIDGIKIRKLVMGKKRIDPLVDLPEITVRIDDKTVLSWEENMIEIAKDMVHSYNNNKFFKSFGNACNEYRGCDFRSICMNLPEPEWKEVRWNPLE